MEAKNELAILDPKEFGIDSNKALELQKDLPQMLSERDTLAEAYDNVIRMEITPETSKMARELRLKIRDNRTKGIEPWHKTNKAYFLAAGKYLDAVKNREVEINQRMEANLEEIEKVEEIARNKELDDRLENRLNHLKSVDPEGVHHGMRDLSDDVFDAYLMALEMRIAKAKEEADRIEKERLAKEAQALIFNERKISIALFGYSDMLEKLTVEFTEDQYQELLHDCEDRKGAEILQKAKMETRNEQLRPYIVLIRDYNKTLNLSDDEFEAELKLLNDASIAEAEYKAEQIRQAEEKSKIQIEYIEKSGYVMQTNGLYFKEGYTINPAILGSIPNDEVKQMVNEHKARILKDKEQDRIAAELKAKQDEEARLAQERAEKQAADLSKGDAERWEDMIKDIEFLKKKYDGKISDVKKLKQVGVLFDKISSFIKS